MEKGKIQKRKISNFIKKTEKEERKNSSEKFFGSEQKFFIRNFEFVFEILIFDNPAEDK